MTSGMTYVRWQRDEPRRCRVFPPLRPPHPSYTAPCLVCDEWLGNGDQIQLIVVGPTNDEDRAKHEAGGWYNAGGVLVHQVCADRLDDDGLQEFVAPLAIYPAEAS